MADTLLCPVFYLYIYTVDRIIEILLRLAFSLRHDCTLLEMFVKKR